MESATTQISSLSSAIDNLIDIVSSKWELIKSFAEAKKKLGFSILSLILPIKGHSNEPEDSSLRNAELFLGEASELHQGGHYHQHQHNYAPTNGIIRLHEHCPPMLCLCASAEHLNYG